MKKKVLFIEDESSLQKTLGDMLPAADLEMVSALDGETGLRLAKEQNPDIVVLDLILPNMYGIEVLRELKKHDETKDVPVIVLTNSEEMADIQEAIDLGAVHYLVKVNYGLDELVERIKSVLEDQ